MPVWLNVFSLSLRPPLLPEETHQTEFGEIPLLMFLSFQHWNVTFQTSHMINLLFQRNGKSFTLLLTWCTEMPLNHSSPVTALPWSGLQWIWSLSEVFWGWNTPWTRCQYNTGHHTHTFTHLFVHAKIINLWKTYVLCCIECTFCRPFHNWVHPCSSQKGTVHTTWDNWPYTCSPCVHLHTDKDYAITIQMIVTSYIRQLQILILLVWNISNDVSRKVRIS